MLGVATHPCVTKRKRPCFLPCHGLVSGRKRFRETGPALPSAPAGVPGPEFTRGHGALHDALAAGRIDDEKPRRAEELPHAVDGPEARLGVSVPLGNSVS
jgi:hypothetical protein